MFDYINNVTNELNKQYDTGGRFDTFANFLGLALNIMIGVGIAGSVIFIAFSGIKFMMSGGDPKATDEAKKALTYAVIGFVLTIAAISVKLIVLNTLGAEGTDLYDEVPNF
jgi:hypothetical protein